MQVSVFFLLLIFSCTQFCECRNCFGKDRNCYQQLSVEENSGKIKSKFKRNLEDVTLLEIENYALDELPDLRDFKNLRKIEIELRNKFDVLDGNFFGGIHYEEIKELKIISAPKYKQSLKANLEHDFFNNLPNLETLEVHHFNIKEVTALSIKGQNLKNVYFRFNRIKIISDMPFEKTKMEKLWLDNNLITTLSNHAFYGYVNLKELHLNHNKIKSIPEKLFDHLEELKEIWLGNNLIEALPVKLFKGTKNLEKANFKNNQITRLSPSLFDGLNLETRLFYGNPCVDGKDDLQRCFTEWNRLETILNEECKPPVPLQEEVISSQIKYPWTGVLCVDNKKCVCSCNLISRKHVLTSTTCKVHELKPENYFVVLSNDDSQKPRRISEFIEHPGFVASYEEIYQVNLMIAILFKEFSLSDLIYPICLNKNKIENYYGKFESFVSFKMTGNSPNQSERSELKIVDHDTCYQNEPSLKEGFVLYGIDVFCSENSKKRDICADKGNSVFIKDNTTYYLMGISNSLYNKDACDYQMLTDIAEHFSWIQNNMIVTF